MTRLTPRARALEELSREVRRLFHVLAHEANALHADLEITAAQRGVLETLAEDGPATVPAIARTKGVSRQHIQSLANQLLETGLIAPLENPAHRRSPLLDLTVGGRETFAEIRAVEAERLRDIAWHLRTKDLESGAQLLRRVRQAVEANRC